MDVLVMETEFTLKKFPGLFTGVFGPPLLLPSWVTEACFPHVWIDIDICPGPAPAAPPNYLGFLPGPYECLDWLTLLILDCVFSISRPVFMIYYI